MHLQTAKGQTSSSALQAGIDNILWEATSPPCQCHSGWLCFCGNYTSLEAGLHSPKPGAASLGESPAGWVPAPRHTSHRRSMDSLPGFTTFPPRTSREATVTTPTTAVRAECQEHTESLVLPCLSVCFHHRNFSSSYSREQNAQDDYAWCVVLPPSNRD